MSTIVWVHLCVYVLFVCAVSAHCQREGWRRMGNCHGAMEKNGEIAKYR